MKEEEKALASLVEEFCKVYAPVTIKEYCEDTTIILKHDDISNFELVVLSYECNSPKFPIFRVDAGALDNNVMLWFVHPSGIVARVKIDSKYLKGVDKSV